MNIKCIFIIGKRAKLMVCEENIKYHYILLDIYLKNIIISAVNVDGVKKTSILVKYL
jgi:hypothetical protein